MKKTLVVCILALAITASWSSAGVRRFTFIYEAPTSAPGSFEFENWLTWKRTTDPEDSDTFQFRHEIEYGVTNRLQASFYFADWEHESTPHDSGTVFEDVALELIYNLSNPVTAPVGISLYQEYKAGYHLFEWESKFIAQKNLGRWILAYNATLEAAWEGEELAETEGEFIQAIGASYEISPRLSVGLEMLHEMVFPDWHDHETIRNFFIGPNASYRQGNWFVTVTALAQATSTSDEADFQLRTIFGIGL